MSELIVTKSFVDSFEESVCQYGKKTAVIDGDISLDFYELNNFANLVASKVSNHVSTLDIPAGPIYIAAILDRSAYSTISLLASLKAGFVYVPIDASLPDNAISNILLNKGIKQVITVKAYENRVNKLTHHHVLIIDELDTTIHVENLGKHFSPNRPVLLLYTSGSTGTPKGALHYEEQMFIRPNWLWEEFPFDHDDVVGQRSNIGFIPSFWESLGGLIAGVTTVIIPNHVISNPDDFGNFVKKYVITRLFFVPYLLQTIINSQKSTIEKFSSLKWISIAGAPLSWELLEGVQACFPHTTIINEYGSTEGNGITYYRADNTSPVASNTVPIGKALPGVDLLVLGEGDRLASVGETGVLCVSTNSTFTEYIGRADLNQSAFAMKNIGGDTQKWFVTGDIVKLLDDSVLEFIGRFDNQLKVKGARVEPEQVETVIYEHNNVLACLVLPWEPYNDGIRGLAAFILEKEYLPNTLDELKRLVIDKLPDYMVPAIIRRVKSFPKTPTGKLDRKSFAKNFMSERTEDTSVDNVRNVIINSIKSLLYIEDELDTSITLSDVGMDSLTTVELVNYWNKQFDVSISIREVLARNSIDDLIHYFECLDEGKDYQSVALTDLVNKYSEKITFSKNDSSESTNSVLVTGATGFLGVYLVKRLIDKGMNVYCLVRSSDQKSASEKLEKSFKNYALPFDVHSVNVVCGDISREYFGLDKAEYNLLSKTVSFVIHSAAKVHHLSSYSDLEKENVQGTIEIINFCNSIRDKELLFVSTSAANVVSDAGFLGDASGYAETKWVSENIIKKSIDHGLSAKIIRCGNISSSYYSPGYSRKDMVLQLALKYFSQLPEIPSSGAGERAGKIDIVPVDVAANILTHILLSSSHYDQDIYELYCPNEYSLSDIVTHISIASEKKIVSFQEWVLKLSELSSLHITPESEKLSAFFEGDTPVIREYFDFTYSDLPKLYAGDQYSDLPMPIVDLEYIKRFVFE